MRDKSNCKNVNSLTVDVLNDSNLRPICVCCVKTSNNTTCLGCKLPIIYSLNINDIQNRNYIKEIPPKMPEILKPVCLRQTKNLKNFNKWIQSILLNNFLTQINTKNILLTQVYIILFNN